MRRTRPSSKTRLVDANSKRIALTTNIPGLAPHQALDRVIEFSHLLASAARPDRLRYAVLGVIGQELERDAFECGPGGVDLGQDVDAVAILRHHLLYPTHLP